MGYSYESRGNGGYDYRSQSYAGRYGDHSYDDRGGASSSGGYSQGRNGGYDERSYAGSSYSGNGTSQGHNGGYDDRSYVGNRYSGNGSRDETLSSSYGSDGRSRSYSYGNGGDANYRQSHGNNVDYQPAAHANRNYDGNARSGSFDYSYNSGGYDQGRRSYEGRSYGAGRDRNGSFDDRSRGGFDDRSRSYVDARNDETSRGAPSTYNGHAYSGSGGNGNGRDSRDHYVKRERDDWSRGGSNGRGYKGNGNSGRHDDRKDDFGSRNPHHYGDNDNSNSRDRRTNGGNDDSNSRDRRSYGGNDDSNSRDRRSNGGNGDSNSRDNRDFGRSGGRDSRNYGRNGGGDQYGRGSGRYRSSYSGGNRSDECGPGAGNVEGSGYEKMENAVMDPRLQDLWTGRAAPIDVKPDDPDLQSETQICRRPNFGTDGRTLKVNVNYFGISLEAAPTEIFKYHVDVERSPFPDEVPQTEDDLKPQSQSQRPRMDRPLSRAVARKVINAALRQYDHELEGLRVAHDGMSAMYSPKKFQWNAKDFLDVNLDGPRPASTENSSQRGRRGPRTFIVRMKLAEAIPLSSLQGHYKNPDENVMPVLQALDVVARHLGAQRMIPIGRNFFAMKKTHELKGGKELCWGYHQAIRVAEKKLLMNVDQAATVFYEPCELMKLVVAALKVRSTADVHGLSERDMKDLARALRKVEVVPTHRKDRQRPIFGISADQADRTTVDIKGEIMSVATYFSRKYQIKLQHPNLPLVNVGSRKAGRENWLPIELCEVAPGQRCPNINDLDTAEIIRQTSQAPHVRRDTILSQIRQAGFENDPYLDAFGMKVKQQLETADIRVLDPPNVQYANVAERPSGGQWNLKDKKFVKGAVLRNWGVVVDANVGQRDVSDFIRTMVDVASKCGLLDCRTPFVLDRRGGEVEDLMKSCYRELEARRNGPPQIIMVIKQDKGSVSYGRIKRTSDTVLGIPSQCIVAASLRKSQKSPQLCANVCLKMNMKLSGKNSILREPLPLVSSCPTIVIGADVEHPRSGMGSRPSIASVVASMDAYSAKYIGRVAAQKAANDIQQLTRMLRELFLAFYENTNRRPERVVYYRDGVSEGRFHDILQTEMRALRKTFKMLSDDYNPPVTFVVVNKRHHMRAFPMNPRDGDRKGNVIPGTVLDRDVVHPHRFDFYLYGHSGIQGTSVPCHYTVLHDENKMSADDLQRLTYYLGYTFARCTRSVSFATPAYYAHLAAGRARFFLFEGSSDTASVGTNFSNSSSFDFAELHKNMLDCMFYV